MYKLLYGIGATLIATGLAIVAYLGFQVYGPADPGSEIRSRNAIEEFKQIPAGPPPPPTSSASTLGETIATIRVPRFGKLWEQPIVEGGTLTGDDVKYLDAAVGHVTGTALPGEVGNFVTAGHRVTYGRPYHDIDKLVAGDEVVVTYNGTLFTYRVYDDEVVSPDETQVMGPQEGRSKVMTLIACHPKFSAAKRYIVFGELVERAE